MLKVYHFGLVLPPTETFHAYTYPRGEIWCWEGMLFIDSLR
jgi:hypothetical protein